MNKQNLHSFLEAENNFKISDISPVSGGSINRAEKLETDKGIFFLKWNDSKPANMFDAEVHGLQLLTKKQDFIRIPEIIDYNGDENSVPGYLLMEYIEPYRGGNEAASEFGTNLARMHNITSGQFGLERNNYIGSLPQSNTKHENWTEFFIRERIEPQLKIAIDSRKLNSTDLKGWERLSSKLESIFPVSKASLLHGDLWGGNYFFDRNGTAVLIDPAVYYGHHEMELAFTKMFGGFSPDFYDSYAIEMEMAQGFQQRIPVYNLYPLLVHVNLFGGSYTSQVSSFLKSYL